MSPLLGEFVGTAVLLLLGCGVCANVSLTKTYGSQSGWIVISMGWAMAVFVAVFIAAPSSGAHLNPAVTIALCVKGAFPLSSALPYMLAQIAGGVAGASLCYLQYRPHYQAETNSATILGTFSTGPAIASTLSNFMSELLATFTFALAVLYLTGPNLGTPDGSLGSLDALPVALVVLAIGLSLGGTTGYAINPARDLGPRIAHQLLPIKHKASSNWSYAWIPIVAPLLGGVMAALVFLLLQQ